MYTTLKRVDVLGYSEMNFGGLIQGGLNLIISTSFVLV